MDVKGIYARRFTPDLGFRNSMWQILCRDFFQRYISSDRTVLEIGAGYCEFINNIRASRKIAVDLNPDLVKYASTGIETLIGSTSEMSTIASSTIDVVFASNFFEHLTREQISNTFREVHRVLKPGGRFLVLQPNIRFCARDYWMFFDHITPIDDRAFVEALEIHGFEPIQVIERFLPYTTKSKLPRGLFLIKMYLRLPIAWRFFGQQSFIVSQKS